MTEICIFGWTPPTAAFFSLRPFASPKQEWAALCNCAFLDAVVSLYHIAIEYLSHIGGTQIVGHKPVAYFLFGSAGLCRVLALGEN